MTDAAGPVLACFCTCPDAGSAARIAEALVEARLAACVNQLPGLRSVYRWEGAIERADEVLLVINELPEVIAFEVAGGLAAYLDWVAEQTRADA